MIKVLNSFLHGTNTPNCPRGLSAAGPYCHNKTRISAASPPWLKIQLSLHFSWTGITMKNIPHFCERKILTILKLFCSTERSQSFWNRLQLFSQQPWPAGNVTGCGDLSCPSPQGQPWPPLWHWRAEHSHLCCYEHWIHVTHHLGQRGDTYGKVTIF